MAGELITPEALGERLDRGGLAVLDCRFALGRPDAGRTAYLEAHVPGAVYLDLERDLSGPPTTDRGRHPMPPPERILAVFGGAGVDGATPVVVYDDAGGMIAARAWWMLRYLGHADVALLDGGWQAWVGSGGAVESGWRRAAPRRFDGAPDRRRLVLIDEVPAAPLLVDARAAERYRGETEPLDPRPGHIPGALNHCFADNLDADGRWLSPAALEARFEASLGCLPDARTVHYCGSGVSACHNVLAQVVAGLPEPRLYCGSWSEWCRDGSRQVMMGPSS